MNIVALDGIELCLGKFTLEVDEDLSGRVTGLFGPSGAGKTTVLEVIAGLRRPAKGLVRLGETLLTDAGERFFMPPEKRRIGYVPQDLALFPHKTVRENLLFGPGENAAGSPL